MSLLEDVFLEDEANEAQELERVIEGGDYEERIASNSDANSEKEDEAEEDKRRVDPASTKTKRIVKNPRFILNPARLTGPRGIQVIPEHFKDFKFRGKGNEKEDLDLILKKLEHWAYRLYPKFKFEDCLKKIEVLGKKRPVMVHLHKIRSDQLASEETVVQNDSRDEENPPQHEPDEFDKLLQQQIELARSTIAPMSSKNNLDSSQIENRSLVMPKASSSPSISDVQKERMLRNRRLAEERRLARLNNSKIGNMTIPTDKNELESKQARPHMEDSSDEESVSKTVTIDVDTHIHVVKNDNKTKIESVSETQLKKRKANIIDSSDEENVSEIKEPSNTQDSDCVVMENSESGKFEIRKEIDNYKTLEEAKTKNNTISSLQHNQVSQTKSSNKLIDTEETDNLSKVQNFNEQVVQNLDVVLESSIIHSTAIQGLMENDNNFNIERGLVNENLVESTEPENVGNSEQNNGQNTNKNEELMDIDFSEEF